MDSNSASLPPKPQPMNNIKRTIVVVPDDHISKVVKNFQYTLPPKPFPLNIISETDTKKEFWDNPVKAPGNITNYRRFNDPTTGYMETEADDTPKQKLMYTLEHDTQLFDPQIHKRKPGYTGRRPSIDSPDANSANQFLDRVVQMLPEPKDVRTKPYDIQPPYYEYNPPNSVVEDREWYTMPKDPLLGQVYLWDDPRAIQARKDIHTKRLKKYGRE
jgi:hypothetical protein